MSPIQVIIAQEAK